MADGLLSIPESRPLRKCGWIYGPSTCHEVILQVPSGVQAYFHQLLVVVMQITEMCPSWGSGEHRQQQRMEMNPGLEHALLINRASTP